MMHSWGMRLLLAGALFVSHLALAQPNPIEFTSEILQVHPWGDLEPATTAEIGAVVEYRVFAENTSATTLPAGRVQIVGPIHEGMQLVPGSPTPSSRRVLREYTIDGSTFSGDENRTATEWANIRAIRWTLLEPMEPGAIEVFVYRIVVGALEPVPDWALANLEFEPAHFHSGVASPAPAEADAATSSIVSSGGSATPSQGFQIVSYVARWEGETLWVVGEVKNVGSASAGVELQVIARDNSGRLVDVATFWPASIDNIRPNMSYGFRHPVTRERSTVRIEVQIVGTRAW